MRIKPIGKLIIFMLVLGGAVGGYKMITGKSVMDLIFPPAKITPAQTPGKIDLPTASTPGNSPGSTPAANLPGSEPGCTDKPEVRMLIWAWNSQMGLLYANGGPQAAKGSLMCKNGVNLKLERQDDTNKMAEALVSFATELKAGKANPTAGCHFIAIMGDGSANFLKGLNDTLRKLGPEYQAKVVGGFGYSRGEDKFMGPAEWKNNPRAAMGGVVAGVLRDGDWNIAQKWLGDNGLSTNPDEKTYDPNALNWVNASDYIDAASKYVSGYSEDRPVVVNGKKTGETKHITVQAIVTWTPGDVQAAQKKGGIVSIVSTKEYSSQMPNVVIGIDKWMKANRATTEGFLRAGLEGGAEVKKSAEALHKAAEISAVVYKEEAAEYWEKYYKGVTEADKTNVQVELGGSQVSDLTDTMTAFGMVSGFANLFAATYKVFGDLVVAQYPSLVPSIYPVEQILDTSYLAALAKKEAPTQAQIAQAKPVFTDPAPAPGKKAAPAPIKRTVSRKAWKIEFQSGQATFTAPTQKVLQKLLADLLVASDTAVEIHGHTDNTGDAQQNFTLSEKRAFAVKDWMEKKSRYNFPDGRIRVFAHGQTQPVAPNSSPDGQAKNRRVEIILGTIR